MRMSEYEVFELRRFPCALCLMVHFMNLYSSTMTPNIWFMHLAMFSERSDGTMELEVEGLKYLEYKR